MLINKLRIIFKYSIISQKASVRGLVEKCQTISHLTPIPHQEGEGVGWHGWFGVSEVGV